MAELTHTISVGAETFSSLIRYLDENPEYLLFTCPSVGPLGATLKVDLKQQKDKKDSAENIVVRWINDIKGKTTNYTDYSSAAKRLGEIKSYCDAVIIAATSK